MSLQGKHIVIGISAGIAAYKIPYLVRLLKKEGAEVKVVMTPNALSFVTPLTLSTLSGNPVLTKGFDAGSGSWNSHVDLGLWADLMLIAPATASTMAKMAHGVADNFLLTTYLSARCPVMAAPSMDLDMYQHPSTHRSLDLLKKDGVHILEAGNGELASGLQGEGRMQEPQEIFEAIEHLFKKKSLLKGKRILVSAGPTYEAIDPVRFIGNHSSGLMGYALAETLARQGAEVYLVSGPTHLQSTHPGITKTDVISAKEMFQACSELFPRCDAAIMAAAIADFKPKTIAGQKIKKGNKAPLIELVPTKDVLLHMGQQKKAGQRLVGFALETQNELDNARQKLRRKNLDFIVLNSLNDAGAGFGTSTNKVSLVFPDDSVKEYPLTSKQEVAAIISKHLEKLLKA